MSETPSMPAPVGHVASFATRYFPSLIGFGIGYAAGDLIGLGKRLSQWMPGASDPSMVGLAASGVLALVGFMVWGAFKHMIGAFIGGLFLGMAVRVALANLGVI